MTKNSQGRNSVKMNIIMNFILTISSFIFPLITFPYVSRILLPVGTGKVAFATSVVSYFTMFGMLGIPTYGIRATAKVRHDKNKLSKLVQEIMTINGIAMLISLFFYILAILFIPKLVANRILFIINISVLLLNFIGCDWLYKGLEQYQFITIRSVIMKFVAVILMFVFVNSTSDFPAYGAITILASLGSYFFNFINLRNIVELKFDKKLNLKQHFGPILTFFVMTVATTIYTSLDSVMLGFMKGDEAVGYYNAAINIKNILVSLVTSVGAVLLPRLSVFIKEKRETEFRDLTSKALYFVVFISIPLSVYFFIYAKQGIYFLSGSAFDNSVIPMQIVMPTLLLIGLSNLFGIQILVPMDRELVVVHSVSLGAVTNLVLNSILIPIYGVSGAALGTLIAEFLVTIYQAFYLRDFLSKIIYPVDYMKILLSAIIAGGVSSLISFLISINNNFFELVISFIVFGLMYFITLIVFREKTFLSIIESFKRN
ncbi:flippase [Streptococcus vestibularis]|uniref:flippase n=1 Tax=Streptococcus vestibularis TaxID=1343 RepID=UPI0026DF8CCD|nr:flippase [Streptococcus vestibularis]